MCNRFGEGSCCLDSALLRLRGRRGVQGCCFPSGACIITVLGWQAGRPTLAGEEGFVLVGESRTAATCHRGSSGVEKGVQGKLGAEKKLASSSLTSSRLIKTKHLRTEASGGQGVHPFLNRGIAGAWTRCVLGSLPLLGAEMESAKAVTGSPLPRSCLVGSWLPPRPESLLLLARVLSPVDQTGSGQGSFHSASLRKRESGLRSFSREISLCLMHIYKHTHSSFALQMAGGPVASLLSDKKDE